MLVSRAVAFKKKGKMLNFRFRPEVASAIKAASQESGYTMTAIIERLVDNYLGDLSVDLITEDQKSRHQEAKRILKGKGPIEQAPVDEKKIQAMVNQAVAEAVRQVKK
jgi:predicted HicB family RNase H-like nuclease